MKRFSKTSWRHFEGALKTSWRRLENVWPRRGLDQDVLKTSSEDVWLRWIYSSWSRSPEDIFRRLRRKTSSRRLQAVFIKTNVCWEETSEPYLGPSRTSALEIFAKITAKSFIVDILLGSKPWLVSEYASKICLYNPCYSSNNVMRKYRK